MGISKLPDYIRIIECKQKGWLFKVMKPFSTYLNVDINDFELLYGINKQQILVESQSHLLVVKLVFTLLTYAVNNIITVVWKQ